MQKKIDSDMSEEPLQRKNNIAAKNCSATLPVLNNHAQSAVCEPHPAPAKATETVIVL